MSVQFRLKNDARTDCRKSWIGLTMRATRSRKVSKRRTKKLARADLLVLQCLQEKLSGQALNCGSQTVRALSVTYPKKRIALVPTSAYCDLGGSLAELLAKYGRGYQQALGFDGIHLQQGI